MKNEELADARADLYRKYHDIYSPKYTSPAAVKFRIKEIIGKLEKDWGPDSWKVKSKKLNAKGRERVKELIKSIEGGI